jgi:peptidoglycan/LPS O-acetylase OafA/YrhL
MGNVTVTSAVDRPITHVQTPVAFREDIEGLRGVAVLLVILFHASVPGFGGGYVGVDVFFVISGFLITGTLVREVTVSGSLGLAAFWGRRVRRLMPALTVVLLATALAGSLIYSALSWRVLAGDTVAAATYTSNLRFAGNEGGYFDGPSSPLLHTWSLSVEEQFYLLWPIMFLGATKLASRRHRPLRSVLLALISIVTGGSAALCVALTARGTPWAYLSAPSRAWEFGVGALLVFAGPRLRSLTHRFAAIASSTGLLALVAAALWFDELTPFPGYLALVPVGGTALVLASGSVGPLRGASHWLRWRPIRMLGRWSYSWYLWHWPMLILGRAWLGPFDTNHKVATSILALGAAALSYHFIENPVRVSALLARPRAAIAFGVAAIAIAVAVGGAMAELATSRLQDPYLATLVAARDARSETGLDQCRPTQIVGETLCAYGPDQPRALIMVIGDSHAAQWSPAVRTAGLALGATTVVRARGGCPAIDVMVRASGKATVSPTCLAFRAETRRLVSVLRPAVVVLSASNYTDRLLAPDRSELLSPSAAATEWVAALSRYTGWLRSIGTTAVVIGGNPALPVDPIECLARHRSDTDCAVEAASVLPELAILTEPEQAALAAEGVPTLDPVSLICDASVCHVEDRSGPVFSDANHLSEPFVMAQVDAVVELLRTALG